MQKLLLTLTCWVLLTSLSSLQGGEPNVMYNSKDIRIAETTTDCHDTHNGTHKRYRFLELSNESNKAVEISFTQELSYNNSCISCDSPNEYTYSFKLNPGQKLNGSCENKTKGLYVLDRFLDGFSNSTLTDFKLINIQVINKVQEN